MKPVGAVILMSDNVHTGHKYTYQNIYLLRLLEYSNKFFYSVLIIFTAGNVYIFVTRQEIYEYLGNFWDPSGIVVIKFHVVKTRSILYRMNRSIDSRVKLV